MKKKKYIALIAALTLSSAFVLNGCSLALPGEETKISTGAELSAEQEILTDGNVQLHTRWYNADGSRLVGATVTVYDGNDQLFQGTTDENGNLEACTLPGNKELRCVITDSSENELAKSDILYKISDNYQAITVYTTHGEADTQKVEIPTSKTVLSAAIYLTENKTLSHANIQNILLLMKKIRQMLQQTVLQQMLRSRQMVSNRQIQIPLMQMQRMQINNPMRLPRVPIREQIRHRHSRQRISSR